MKTNQPFMPQSPVAAAQNPPMAGNLGNAVFDVDLTDVKESSYIIPDGDYQVKCVDVEQAVSQAGNPQFVWTFAIIDGEHKDMEFKSFTALTPAAMWKVAETVTALGLGSVGTKVKFSRSEVLGKRCIATIEESEYKGVVRSTIANLRPLGGK